MKFVDSVRGAVEKAARLFWVITSVALVLLSLVQPVYVFLKFGDFSKSLKNYFLFQSVYEKADLVSNVLLDNSTYWVGAYKIIYWFGNLPLFTCAVLFCYAAYFITNRQKMD